MGLARLLRGLRKAGNRRRILPVAARRTTPSAPRIADGKSMEDVDAAVFFGRDPQILRGLDALRGMRATGVEGLFVVLGPSGVGKSSFLRAGLLPRLRRDRKNFLVCDIVRPERAARDRRSWSGPRHLAARSQAGPVGPALGDVKAACLDADTAQLKTWLREAQRDAARRGRWPRPWCCQSIRAKNCSPPTPARRPPHA